MGRTLSLAGGLENQECVHCGKRKALLRCESCRRVYFCGHRCSVLGYPLHKVDCLLLQLPMPPLPEPAPVPAILPPEESPPPRAYATAAAKTSGTSCTPHWALAVAPPRRAFPRRSPHQRRLTGSGGRPPQEDTGICPTAREGSAVRPGLSPDVGGGELRGQEYAATIQFSPDPGWLLISEEINFLESKIQEACDAEEEVPIGIHELLLRRASSLRLAEEDGPGAYYVREKTVDVSASPEDGDAIARLRQGQEVTVLELAWSEGYRGTCARISDPAGWVNLGRFVGSREVIRCPTIGTYHVVHGGIDVTIAASLASDVVAELPLFTPVLVLEVVHPRNGEDDRFWGRIANPPGWISLLDTETGQTWAVKVPEQRRDSHPSVMCDDCGVTPIVGMRYMSMDRDNYDLCGQCRAQDTLTDSFIPVLPCAPKIRGPKDLALMILLGARCHLLLADLSPCHAHKEQAAKEMAFQLLQVYTEDTYLSFTWQLRACDLLFSCLHLCEDFEMAKKVLELAIVMDPAADRFLDMADTNLRLEGAADAASPEKSLDLLNQARCCYSRALDLDHQCVAAYLGLNALLEDLGEVDTARALAQDAMVSAGLWDNHLQRPAHWIPGIQAKAWHGPQLPAARHLESGLGSVLPELLAFAQDVRTEWHHYPHHAFSGDVMDVKVLMGLLPGWYQVKSRGGEESDLQALLMADPSPEEDGHVECPQTLELLSTDPSIAEAAHMGVGFAVLARLGSGARLSPRCGGSNARLTCVRVLSEAEDGGVCVLEVGSTPPRRLEPRSGVQVFDDSFEHSFTNTSRVDACMLLLAHFWHPDVPREEWEEYASMAAPPHLEV